MGAVNFSIDARLLALLVPLLGLERFIETGTFRGDSLAAVLPLFRRLLSVELSPELHAAATARFAGEARVELHLGSSPGFLAAVVSQEPAPPATLFWLDAHWCSDSGAVGEMSTCPLLEELAAIGRLHPDSVIAIDDARLFLTAPPAAYRASAWPGFQEILEALRPLAPGHEVMVLDDVIWLHPVRARDLLRDYARDHGTDWLSQQVKAASRDDLLAQLLVKDQAITDLTRTAEERLALILRCQAELEERGRQAALQTAELRAALGTSEKTNTERLTLIKRLSTEIEHKESTLASWTQKLQNMLHKP